MLFLIGFLEVSDTFFLNRALEYYGLTIQDLGFRRDRADETYYKPPGVIRSFREPFFLFSLMEELHSHRDVLSRVELGLNDYFRLSITGPYRVISRELPEIQPLFPDTSAVDSTDTVSVPISDSLLYALRNFVLAVDMWNFYRGNASGVISEKSMGRLYTFLAGYLEDDSTGVRRFLDAHNLHYEPFFEDSMYILLDSLRLRDLYFGSLVLLDAFLLLKKTALYLKNSSISFRFGSPYGPIVIDTVVPDDSFLIFIDTRGPDVYRDILCGPVCAILDLSGDDEYAMEFLALDGGKFLFDAGGMDRYERVKFFGGSLMGISYVEDASGDDYYDVGKFSLAASILGVSIFRDGGGDDLYRGVNTSFGFSGLLGFSDFGDSRGNDVYQLGRYEEHRPLWKNEYVAMGLGFSMGYREPLGGGLSVFEDDGGNDVYTCGTYCLGAGYWYGTGLFLDVEGNDRYVGTEYGLGAGIHLASGGFFDLSGDDIYVFRAGPSIGSGHDWAVGVFYDRKGRDIYHVSGGLGNSLYNSTGIFIDGGGDDVYSFTEKDLSCGQSMKSGRSREYMGIAVFVDVDGRDTYPEGAPCRNGSIWRSGDIGVGIDGQ